MKTKGNPRTQRAVYAGMYLVLLIFVVATPFVIASGQSTIREQTSSTTSTSTSRPTSLSQSSIELGYVVDTRDKYKLVLASGYKRKDSSRSKKLTDDEAFVEATSSKLENFVEQINQAGAEGYKLLSVIAGYGEGVVGIVKLDGIQYEYDWFMTDGVGSALRDGNAKYQRLSTGGFRLFNHFELTIYCVDDSSCSGSECCKTKSVFLFEKQKGEEKRTLYAFLWHRAGSGLTNELQQKLTEGFVPSYLFSDYQLLVERAEGRDDRVTDKPDVRVVVGSRVWGKGEPSKSKINELAKQGYRLEWINNTVALMYKDGVTATPVTYVWLHATTKRNWKIMPRMRTDFEERLTNLQESGARYRMIYRDDQGYTQLIFEQKAVDDGKRREYQVLGFDFQVDVDAASQKVSIDLTAASKETLKMLTSLARDGFVVRDLFFSSGYNVVLERTR